jgi:ABC-type Na+ efflux pump permease subunit
MNQIAMLDLLVILLASVLLAAILGRAFARHEKPFYDGIFCCMLFLLFGVGNLLDNLSILPKGWALFIALSLVVAAVIYGLIFVSRRMANRNS